LSAPPLIRMSLPPMHVHTTALTKSLWPMYLHAGTLEAMSHDQMALSQDPAKTSVLFGPPTATHVTGAEGPR